MDDKKIINLLDRYLQGTCSMSEKAWVENFYMKQLKEGPLPPENNDLKNDIWNSIVQETLHTRSSRTTLVRLRRKYIAVAASVLFLLGTIFFIWQQRQLSIPNPLAINSPESIGSLTKGTTLTLANGKTIRLSEQHGEIRIGDAITYEDGKAVDLLRESQVLTIQTGAGRQYKVVMSDGTVVSLNAGSKLIYPSHFGTSDREVELVGEGYFEVASHIVNRDNKLIKQPFRVKFAGQTLDVLGTKFNVSAYGNDPVSKISLVEGKIVLQANGGKPLALSPGQQAVLKSGDAEYLMAGGMINQALAWTEGRFDFEGLSFPEAMRQIERWYDIKVVYQQGTPNIQLFGDMDRSTSLDGVVKLIQSLGLHVKKQHRTLYISAVE